MAIETVDSPDKEKVLAEMKKVFGSDAERITAFVSQAVGSNDEHGIQKWCVACNAFTGHLALPGSHWYVERCMRCGRIDPKEVLVAEIPGFSKPILMPPGFDERGVLAYLLETAGPAYIARATELWFQKKVKERLKELIRERKALREKL